MPTDPNSSIAESVRSAIREILDMVPSSKTIDAEKILNKLRNNWELLWRAELKSSVDPRYQRNGLKAIDATIMLLTDLDRSLTIQQIQEALWDRGFTRGKVPTKIGTFANIRRSIRTHCQGSAKEKELVREENDRIGIHGWPGYKFYL